MSKYDTKTKTPVLPERTPQVFPVHKGRAILVTGGAGGIGRAVARLLASEGASVAVADRDADAAKAVAAEIASLGQSAAGIGMDVATVEGVGKGMAEALAALGRIDGLVNCAAVVMHADPLDIPRSDWERQFAINLFGAYEVSRLAARHMIASGRRGAIVSIASEAGKKGHRESLAYSASKAALISMTRMLSDALAAHDINVNSVCPGGVDTPMLHEVSKAYSDVTGEAAPSIFSKMTSQQLGRHLQPMEVARVVSFLMGDGAMLVRGQAINADAGETPY